MKRTLTFFTLLLYYHFARTAEWNGIVFDATTHQPLPTVQIYNATNKQGTVSDNKGAFSIPVSSDNDSILFIFLGYTTLSLKPSTNTKKATQIVMTPTVYGMDNITVQAKKRHSRYRRKNNPAVELVEKVIDKHKQRSASMPYSRYSYSEYEKITVALFPVDVKENKFLDRHLPFLRKYIDTTSIKETFTTFRSQTLPLDTYAIDSTYQVDKYPVLWFFISETNAEKTSSLNGDILSSSITKTRKDGIEKIIDYGNLDSYLMMIFKPIDIFANQIQFIQTSFVSPLSPTLATRFYNYFIIDTVKMDNNSCIDLGFVPANPQSFGLTGHLYITNDSSYSLKHTSIHIPKSINMNWVKSLHIEESFCQNDSILSAPQRLDMGVQFSIMNKAKHTLYAHLTRYFCNFSPLQDTPDTKMKPTEYFVSEDDKCQGSASFDTLRRVQLTPAERRLDSLHSDIMARKPLRNLINTIRAFVSEYVPTKRPPDSSRWDFGPILNTLSFHNQEGTRLRIGGKTTANLNKRWFTSLYLAYGFRDKRFKGGIDIIHSFNNKKYHPYEPLKNNLTLSLKYDLENYSESQPKQNRDRLISTIAYKTNPTPMQYVALAQIKYERQFINGLSIATSLSAKNSQPNGSYGINGHRLTVPYNNRSPLTLQYIKINPDNTLTERPFYHNYYWIAYIRYSFKNFFYSDPRDLPSSSVLWENSPAISLHNELGYIAEDGYLYNRIQVAFEKKFDLSMFGYMNAFVQTGFVLGKKVPFTRLFSSPTNHSLIINRYAFALMNEMEFISDRYIEWHLSYHLNGLIINRIPGLNKTKLRGVVSFHGVLGYLNNKNNPNLSTGLYRLPFVYYPKSANTPVSSKTSFDTDRRNNVPYMEISAGIENIFKILRIDYVRRLTHTSGLGFWQKNGIRFAFQLSL